MRLAQPAEAVQLVPVLGTVQEQKTQPTQHSLLPSSLLTSRAA